MYLHFKSHLLTSTTILLNVDIFEEIWSCISLQSCLLSQSIQRFRHLLLHVVMIMSQAHTPGAVKHATLLRTITLESW